MNYLQNKITSIVRKNKQIKPSLLLSHFRDQAKTESSLRFLVANGIIILNQHRKLQLPKNKGQNK